jgi:predicted metal-dependent hydrolase
MNNPLPVEVIRSERRRRTVDARIVGGKIQVRAPSRMSQRELDKTVAELVATLQRRHFGSAVDLPERAAALAKRFGLPQPERIVFSDALRSTWGRCRPATGDISISTRLTEFPSWVLDYVVVHELAHLVEANHSARFHAVVDRYPRAERAQGFLIGVLYSSSDEREDPGCEIDQHTLF